MVKTVNILPMQTHCDIVDTIMMPKQVTTISNPVTMIRAFADLLMRTCRNMLRFKRMTAPVLIFLRIAVMIL